MAYGALAARHSSDPGTSSAPFPRSAVVEYRKDGTVSKMRSHKGNIPILPQTKLCPHCPAKFTRTTHLNRHLRTHTGERLHRCDTCEAQFTRSDLLTRHKKTCGDPSHANRTRRRSCQACANSKVKCDLQQPCSKCQARGKECVFVIRPPRSSTAAKTNATTVVPEHSADPVDQLVSKLSTPPTSSSDISPVAPRTTMDSNVPPDQSYHWNAPVADQMENRPEELSFSSDGPSPSPSEAISSTSDACPHPNSNAEPVQNQVNAFYSSEVFEPFFPSIISGYNAVAVDHDNSRDQTCAPDTPLISSSAEDAFHISSQCMGSQQRPHHPETLFYSSSSQQVISSAEHMQRSYTEDNYIPQHTPPVDVRYQALAEQQHYRLVDSSAYVRNRVKSANPYNASGGMWRTSCEGLINAQLHYHYPPKSAGDAFCEKSYRYPVATSLRVGSDSTNRWSVPSETARVAVPDLSPRHSDSDAQTYRSHLSECLADAIRWSGSNVMRRQVTSTDFT